MVTLNGVHQYPGHLNYWLSRFMKFTCVLGVSEQFSLTSIDICVTAITWSVSKGVHKWFFLYINFFFHHENYILESTHVFMYLVDVL